MLVGKYEHDQRELWIAKHKLKCKRLVFTCVGIGIGVITQSAQRIEVKTKCQKPRYKVEAST